jgi:hypothetical protein
VKFTDISNKWFNGGNPVFSTSEIGLFIVKFSTDYSDSKYSAVVTPLGTGTNPSCTLIFALLSF